MQNNNGTSSVHVLRVAIVNIESNDNDILVLLDSDDDACFVVDRLDKSTFSL